MHLPNMWRALLYFMLCALRIQHSLVLEPLRWQDIGKLYSRWTIHVTVDTFNNATVRARHFEAARTHSLHTLCTISSHWLSREMLSLETAQRLHCLVERIVLSYFQVLPANAISGSRGLAVWPNGLFYDTQFNTVVWTPSCSPKPTFDNIFSVNFLQFLLDFNGGSTWFRRWQYL